MSKQINYWNQNIENKIREYREGVDYSFDGEKYHAPTEMEKGRATRVYRVNHPQLKKELLQILRKYVDVMTSLDFKKKVFIDEKSIGNNVVSCFTVDEFGNRINFENKKNSEPLLINFLRSDNKDQERVELSQYYQEAKSRYEEKIRQTGQKSISLVPPQGTKCWNCYEIFSDNDISEGRYKAKNMRLEGSEKSFYRTFNHLSCKAKHYDPSRRNNYRYCEYWNEEWLRKNVKSAHEYSCQDCLNKIRDEVTGNLIWLETWDKQEQDLIARTKQIIAEIEKRLQKLSEVGGYNNCGIRLCCAEHDKNHGDSNHQHQSSDQKTLITGARPITKIDNPKLGENNNQGLSADLLTKLLKWMKKEQIVQISLDQVSNQLVAKYDSNTEKVLADDFFTTSQQLRNYFQQNPEVKQSFSQQDLEKQINQNHSKDKGSYGWILPTLGISSLVLILVWIIVKKNKERRK